MKAEIYKARYLPLPRWTAVALLGVAALAGLVLIAIGPDHPSDYEVLPATLFQMVFELVAVLIPVWLVTLEFNSGTMQRTLTAESSRHRVLIAKLVVSLGAVLVLGVAAAAALGGLAHLAALQTGVAIDDGTMARHLFGAVISCIPAAVLGFGFGLLGRSFAGGLTMALGFILVLGGMMTFVAALRDIAYTVFETDLGNAIMGVGQTTHGPALSLLGVSTWCLVIVIPGWTRFVAGDLK